MQSTSAMPGSSISYLSLIKLHIGSKADVLSLGSEYAVGLWH
jgi:hypothetical protein